MNEPRDQQELREYRVSQYLDGTLTDAERRAFEAELETDSALAGVLREYRSVDALIGRWAAKGPELDWARFETEVRGRRRRVDARARRAPLVFKLFVPLAAAASIMITFSLLQNTPSEETPMVATVRIAAPAPSAYETNEVFVSYSYGTAEVEEEFVDSPTPQPVLALAAVGAHVRWPTTDGWTSTY